MIFAIGFTLVTALGIIGHGAINRVFAMEDHYMLPGQWS